MLGGGFAEVTFDGYETIDQEPVASVTPAPTYKPRQSFNGEKFSGGLSYPSAVNLNHNALRLRSIKAFEETAQARSAVNRLNDSVINTGLSLQSSPITSLLGLDTEFVQDITDKIESRFALWANSKQCDYSENNTLGQMERVEFNNQLVKGDYFAYLNYSEDATLINPLQVKIITPERISTPWGSPYIEESRRRGTEIVDGVEIGENGEELNFYVKVKKRGGGGGTEYLKIPRKHPDTGRMVMIHGNRQRFGNEVRGVPLLSHIAHELEKITDYSVLELGAAVANAAVAAVVTPSENAPASNPMPVSSFVPPSMTSDMSVGSEIYDHGYTNIGKNVFSNTGGLLISSLNAGEKYESFDTKRPNVDFIKFTDGMTKYLSASLNIPIEILNMVFGQNYSASRAAFLLFWQSLNVWRDEFVSDFMTPVYEAWLLGEVATGNLVLPGYDTSPHFRAAWNNAVWIGVPAPSLDPLKEERAATIRIANGLTTHEQESQLRHKTSFNTNVEKLWRENGKLANANSPLKPPGATNA